MLPIRIKACSESDLRMLGNLARNIQRVLPVTQADIDAAAALGEGWVVWKVIEVNDPIDNLRGGTQLVIKQNSITPGQNVRRVLIVSGPGGETVVIGPGPSPLLLPDAIANSLSYVKAFGGTEQRDIPDNYLQRQFIYMMDGSYLLTDIVPTYDGRVEMDFQTTSIQSDATTYLGGRSAAYPAGLRLGTGSGNSRVVVTAFSNSAYTATTEVENNTRYKFTFNNKVATLESGGTTLFTNTFTGENANGAALCINGLNSAGTITANSEGIYLYSFKAWNGQGELVMNLVPAIQKGTVPVVGFYDTVSGTFKTATAGTFAAGGEAVPTPGAPIDIVSNNGVLKVSSQGQIYTDGTVETINVHGKNLFNKNTVQTGYRLNTINAVGKEYGTIGSSLDFIVDDAYCVSELMEVEAGATYVKNTPADAFHRFHFYDANKICVAVSNSSVVAAPADAKYMSVCALTAEIDTVQVEKGDTATPYEPYYNGGTATAEMLLKVGDYQDVQSILDGAVTRNVGVKVFNGTEKWASDAAGTGGYIRFNCSLNVAPKKPGFDVLANIFLTRRSVVGLNETSAMISGHGTNTNIYLAFPANLLDGDLTTLVGRRTAFNNWLSAQYNAGTPFILLYALATPTTKSVAGQTLQVQDGDNTLEITQASLSGLELEAEYQKVA